MDERNGTYIAAKVIAIVIFAFIMTALAIAIISDFVIFAEYIFSFIFACIASVIVFFIAIILMIISCVLIFGIFILKSSGFWPTEWTKNTFHEIMADAKVSQEAISAFIGIRVMLIITCVICFALSIVALALNKGSGQKLPKAFGVLTLIFSILGLLSAIVMTSIVNMVF